jgi:hypothetical protein
MKFNFLVSILFATALTLGAVLAQASGASVSKIVTQTLISTVTP